MSIPHLLMTSLVVAITTNLRYMGLTLIPIYQPLVPGTSLSAGWKKTPILGFAGQANNIIDLGDPFFLDSHMALFMERPVVPVLGHPADVGPISVEHVGAV